METFQLITLYFDLGMNYKDILDALDPDLFLKEIFPVQTQRQQLKGGLDRCSRVIDFTT